MKRLLRGIRPFALLLILTAGCASPTHVRPLHEAPSATALLAMIKQLTELPPDDLLNAEKVIALSQLPFREEVERRGQHGIARSFDLSEFGKPIPSGTYWYRSPIRPDRTRAYLHLRIDKNLFCLTRADVEMVFGNVWLTGFRNDRMPGANPQQRRPDEHHFGLMSYRFLEDRVVNFSFNVNQPDCITNFSLNEGKEK